MGFDLAAAEFVGGEKETVLFEVLTEIVFTVYVVDAFVLLLPL